MKMRFHGAVGTVTGTMTELYNEENDVRWLVDCGSFQGNDAMFSGAFTGSVANGRPGFPFDPSSIRFVLLTHAHLDHCGRLPELVKQGFGGYVYATEATKRLATALLHDAVQFSEGRFDHADVAAIRWRVGRAEPYDEWFPVAPNMFAVPFRSSHLLGAVGWAVNWGPGRRTNPVVVFSGDVGPHCDKEDGLGGLLARNQTLLARADNEHATLVLESTYGGEPKARVDRQARRDALEALLLDASRGRKKVLIPAFALGRVQEVLFDIAVLKKRNPELRQLPVYAPGRGLSFEASKVYSEELFAVVPIRRNRPRSGGMVEEVRVIWANRSTFEELGMDVTTARGAKEARATLSDALGLTGKTTTLIPSVEPFIACDGPAVLVAPSGMGEGGFMHQALTELRSLAPTVIATVGYIAPGSFLANIVQSARLPESEQERLAEFGRARMRHAASAGNGPEVVALGGYGGHGDVEALGRYAVPAPSASKRAPTDMCPFDMVYLVHGDDAARQSLASALNVRMADANYDTPIRLPSLGEWHDLNRK